MYPALLADAKFTDGRRVARQFAADGNELTVAFWRQEDEDEFPHLHLATSAVDQLGSNKSYQLVQAAISRLGHCSVRLFDIKVISPNSPLAKMALGLVGESNQFMTASWESVLDRGGSREMVVYPPHDLLSVGAANSESEIVLQQLVRLLNRAPGAHLQASRVVLRDKTDFNGVPISLHVDPKRSAVVQFLADGENVPRSVELNEIAAIM